MEIFIHFWILTIPAYYACGIKLNLAVEKHTAYHNQTAQFSGYTETSVLSTKLPKTAWSVLYVNYHNFSSTHFSGEQHYRNGTKKMVLKLPTAS